MTRKRVLRARVAELEARIAELEKELAEAQRVGELWRPYYPYYPYQWPCVWDDWKITWAVSSGTQI
jgi:hypothetical protein